MFQPDDHAALLSTNALSIAQVGGESVLTALESLLASLVAGSYFGRVKWHDRACISVLIFVVSGCASRPMPTAPPSRSLPSAEDAPQVVSIEEICGLQSENGFDDNGKSAKLGFKLSRTGSLNEALTVRLTTVSATAVENSDFKAVVRQAVIPQGSAAAEFSIDVIDDSEAEWSEMFAVSVAACPPECKPTARYVIGKSKALEFCIRDNDLSFGTSNPNLTVNNDDDNDNGVPDLQEDGPVENEDDLEPLPLNVPKEYRQGSKLIFHLKNDTTRVWLNSAKGGKPVIGEPGSHTFVMSPAKKSFPSVLFIEAIAGSKEVGDVEFSMEVSEAEIPTAILPLTRP